MPVPVRAGTGFLIVLYAVDGLQPSDGLSSVNASILHTAQPKYLLCCCPCALLAGVIPTVDFWSPVTLGGTLDQVMQCARFLFGCQGAKLPYLFFIFGVEIFVSNI